MGWIAGKEWALIKRSLAAMVVITVAQLAIAPAMGQRPRLLAPRAGQPQEELVAVAGSPFGVGKLTVLLPRGTTASTTPANEYTLAEKNGRALYSTFGETPVRALLREILDRPQPLTVYFLFKGDEPLELTLYAPTAIERQTTPIKGDPQLHARLLDEWWRNYTARARPIAALLSDFVPIPLRTNRNDDYPHLIDTYLTAMLSRRLSLGMPAQPQGLLGARQSQPSELEQAVGLLAGTEAARAALQREIMLDNSQTAEPADQPLPQPVQMTPIEELPPPGDIKVEPIASHVPAECLYLRFGNFPNYLWFKARLDEWGGDLRNLILARGVNYGITARTERQLSLHETPLSKLLGPTVIADVAMIGDDTFFREGAATGMLFQARNNFALSSDINRQRTEALAKEPGCSDQKVEIAGHTVSFLSTPDNRVHSFYAIDGDFHLVTTSRAMVERFYAAGKGENALAAAPDFLFGRRILPLERQDTVFAFLSSEFFKHLASPAYQIEMNRRLRSITEIELVEMARLAAHAEGVEVTSLEQLVAGGYLPKSILQRADGSRLVFDKDGVPSDSLRGPAGSFIPVPDLPPKSVTASEAAAYGRFAQSFQSQMGRMDPIVAAVKQLGIENDRERVEIAARMIPLAAKHYSLAMRLLGPADKQRLSPVPSDLISVEGFVSGNILSLVQSFVPVGPPAAGPYHLFFGTRNTDTAFDIRDGQVNFPGGALNSIPFYVGAWPTPGILGVFGIGRPNLPRDQEGYGRSGLFWERQMGPITVAAPRRDTLADVSPQLSVVDSKRPGQLWVHVGDVSQSKLAQLANSFGYMRARQIAQGNSYFLHSLTTQLGVAPEEAMTLGEQLLGAQLVSTVGGQYELVKPQGEFPFWTSTALENERRSPGLSVPNGFVSPPLDWLRGLDLELAIEQAKLSLDGQLIMQRRAPEAVPAPPPELLPAK
jgi:hypothetical protein